MFDTHQSRIQRFARKNPDNLARTMWLAVLSANTPLYSVGGIMDDMENGVQSTVGMRINACSSIWLSRRDIYHHCEDIYYHAKDWREASDDMLAYLSTLPGLNIIKAGFACQLAYGLSGCLDTHNLRRYGIPPRAFANFKQRTTLKGRMAMVTRYNDTVAHHGGTRRLWNSWCAYVSARRPNWYPTASYASELHCRILGV